MKILQVTPGYPPNLGGVENSVYELVQRLRKLNHDVGVVTAGISSVGVKDNVWRLPVTLKFGRDWGDLLMCASLMKTLREIPFDVIHAHTPRKLFAENVALFKLLSRRKFPYIVSIRLLNTSLTGFWNGLLNVYQQSIERFVLKYATYVVVQTQENKDFCIKKFGIPSEKIEIIPNGINLNFFNPNDISTVDVRQKYNVEDKKVILFAGRLTGQKGVPYLLRAVQTVIKTIPNVVLLIAGDGPEIQLFRRLTLALGLRQNVVFLGKIKHEEMPELYSIANVFVLPSLSESFPNSMLEAMAMRNPMVITRVGVVPEILENYRTAILVEPADSSELANAIVELLTDTALAEKLGSRARDLVCKKFTWEPVVEQTLNLYEAALN
jgi:glycosyltransferase involved in cell wall biosynthesis